MEDLIYIIILVPLVVLLPVIPAYILYKALPSGTKVNGPFKGLNIQLTGAFGGYFIVALLTGSFITSYTYLKPKYELWTVEGKIQLKEGGFDPEDTIITIKPPDQFLSPKSGRFVIDKVPLGKELGTKKPSLIIQKEGYKLSEVTLEKEPPIFEGIPKYKIMYNEKDRNISINSPIILEKKTPPKPLYRKPYSEETAQEPTRTH
jgi:hypothetical protein